MNAINFSDIVEENGRTIRENNNELQHNIPIGSLVEVQYDEWYGEGACQKVHARLYVVKHTRDCDGTPLYSLCKKKKMTTASIIVTCEDGEIFKFNDDISTKIYNEVKHGFAEESLKVIEITPDVIAGKGALCWKR